MFACEKVRGHVQHSDKCYFAPTDPYGIQSSKTTGEPPLVLANTVFFAIKQAVAEARRGVGLTGPFSFDAPATVQRIQQACAFRPANIVQQFESKREEEEMSLSLPKRPRIQPTEQT